MKKHVEVFLTAATSIVSTLVAVAGTGLQTIDDIRVDAIVDSHWGQRSDTGYSNSGNPCFNLFTPDNAPCGCVSVPLAQIIRHWRYPASLPAGVSLCRVDGADVQLAYGGQKYDFDSMPALTAGASEAERAAIGRLAYDCAAALHSMFTAAGTFAYGMFSFVQLRDIFGYASAVGYVPFVSCAPNAELEKTIIANLDAKCPVSLSLFEAESAKAHQALIDGYGYHEGKLYFHFNLGWCNVRNDDAWYELGKTVDSETGNEYDLIDGLVYNIFPDRTGDVLSGRILDAGGMPVAGAKVRASLAGRVVDTVETDKNGIYSFILPGDETYRVTCEGHSVSVALPSSSCASLKVSSKIEGAIWSNPFNPTFNFQGELGGSPGNDIVLSGEANVLGPFNPSKAGKGAFPYCGIVYDGDGNPCGTIAVKFTKPSRGKSNVSAQLKLLDGKSYSLSSTPVDVSDSETGLVAGKTIKRLGVLKSFEIGENGFLAEIVKSDGTTLSASTADLSGGLAEGTYAFKTGSLPSEINGLPVLGEMIPDGTVFTVNAKGKMKFDKAAKVKYAKIKNSKPAAYELVVDTAKGKTNLMGLKLAYTAKTAMLKGSFTVHAHNAARRKIVKQKFTVSGMVIGGKAVCVATCKKPALACSVKIEKTGK